MAPGAGEEDGAGDADVLGAGVALGADDVLAAAEVLGPGEELGAGEALGADDVLGAGVPVGPGVAVGFAHNGSGLVRSPDCWKNSRIFAVSNESSGNSRPHTRAAYGVAIWSNRAMTGPTEPGGRLQTGEFGNDW